MAFTDQKYIAKQGVSAVRQASGGLWALHQTTDQYRAWKFWQHEQFGKRFFHEWITVWSEWPPTTQSGADAVAAAISEIRESKYQAEKSPIGGDPVQRHPKPWAGYIPKAEPV